MNRIFHPSQQTHRGGYRGGLDEQVEPIERESEWPDTEAMPEAIDLEVEEIAP